MADQDLAEIHEELTVDHVYVHPSLRSLVSEADEAALEDQVAQTADPTYVVVWPFRSGDTYGGKASDLLTRLHHAYPEPGIYLSTTTQLEATDYSGVRVDGRQFGVAGEADGRLGDYSITSIVDLEKHQDLPSALSRTVEVLEMEPAERDELHDELLSQHRKEYLAENPPEDEGSPVVGGVVTGVLVLVAAFVAWRVVVSFRRNKQPAPLPKSAMQRIRAAQGRELSARAGTELQALGDKLDELEIAPRDDRESWQSALDHYAAARRLLDPADPDQLDVVGALVLTQRGEHALVAARAGRAWEPIRTCFLNPLHGRADRERQVEWQGRTLDVPMCTACRTALQKKKVPDILDVVRRGEPRHYFETGVEPWSSSGYGSLEPDLLKLLSRRGT